MKILGKGAVLLLLAFLSVGWADEQEEILLGGAEHWAEYHEDEYACRKPAVTQGSKADALPALLKSQYKMAVELTDWKKNSTGELTNLGNNKTGDSGLIKWMSGKVYQWIFRKNGTSFYVEDDGKKCNFTNSTVGSPMNFSVSKTFLEKFSIPVWKGVADLLASARKAKVYWIEKNDTGLVRGIPALHWTGCLNSTDNSSHLQFDVCYTKEGVILGDGNAGQVPLQIHVKAYAAKPNPKVDQMKAHQSYQVFFLRSNYSIEDAEKYLLPPRGVYCDGMEKAANKTYPRMPDKFDVSVEYVAAVNRRIDDIQLSYDSTQKLIAFTFTGDKDDVGFATGLNLGKGKYRIIHDFLYGYQYVMNDGGDKCEDVKGIPTTAGDSVASGQKEGRLLTLMNSTELLMGARRLNFSYVGKRTMDEGVPADVFVAKNSSVVYEAWFTTSNWAVSTVYTDFNKSTLLLLDVYHTKAGVVTRSSQRFHSFTDLNGTSFPMGRADVSACLNKTRNSYFYFQLDEKIASIDKFGRERVKSALREKLASLANVSVVRISDFYLDEVYDEDSGNNVRVFFILGDMNKAPPSHTLKQKTEISAEEAGKNLKKALESSVKVRVTDFGRQSLDVTIRKDSLDSVPSDMHPGGGGKTKKMEGYSGGSMAALGICMLLIGAVLGLVAAFYLWRRRGGGGAFAYQVYE